MRLAPDHHVIQTLASDRFLDLELRTTSKVLPHSQVRIFRALIASKKQRSKDRRSDDEDSHDEEDHGAEQ